MAVALTGLIALSCLYVTGVDSRMISSIAVSFFISTSCFLLLVASSESSKTNHKLVGGLGEIGWCGWPISRTDSL